MTAMSATHSKEEDRDKIEARLELARKPGVQKPIGSVPEHFAGFREG